jgi:hypothetical protein
MVNEPYTLQPTHVLNHSELLSYSTAECIKLSSDNY